MAAFVGGARVAVAGLQVVFVSESAELQEAL